MAAVVGVPHPRLGQAVAAAVVLQGVGGAGTALEGRGSARGGVGESSPQLCARGDEDNTGVHEQQLRGTLEGQKCGDVSGELLWHCRQALSPYKVPPQTAHTRTQLF
jgi:acyl-CoA synthetase (AMP-forming)/AMP-acid ligase II